MDYRACYDRDYISAFDLEGREVTVTISRAEKKVLVGQKGTKASKPVIYFEGKERGLAVNKTNGKIIAGMYGNDMDQWVGKRITLFPSTTSMGSETVDCVRVKPGIPQEPRKDAARAAS